MFDKYYLIDLRDLNLYVIKGVVQDSRKLKLEQVSTASMTVQGGRFQIKLVRIFMIVCFISIKESDKA